MQCHCKSPASLQQQFVAISSRRTLVQPIVSQHGFSLPRDSCRSQKRQQHVLRAESMEPMGLDPAETNEPAVKMPSLEQKISFSTAEYHKALAEQDKDRARLTLGYLKILETQKKHATKSKFLQAVAKVDAGKDAQSLAEVVEIFESGLGKLLKDGRMKDFISI